MPPETDSSLVNGNKDKEEGNNLYSMIFLKINEVDYMKPIRRHHVFLSQPVALETGIKLCVSVFVGGVGSVHIWEVD